MSGLLGDLFGYGNTLKRKLNGLLSDPVGTIALGATRIGEDQAKFRDDVATGFGDSSGKSVAGYRSVLTTPQQAALARALAGDQAAQQGMAAATVWHGSPHTFDKFDASKIGTGEGAQAYGHGLYLADSPQVAQNYKTTLSNPKRLGSWSASANGENLYQIAQQSNNDLIKAYADKLVEIKAGGKTDAQAIGQIAKNLQKHLRSPIPGFRKDAAEALDFFKNAEFKLPEASLYKVNLPDSAISKMLDWDSPLNEAQRAPISQAAMDQFGSGLSGTSGEHLYKEVVKQYEWAKHPNPKDAATEWLRSQGVPGIRYLDGGSRGAGSGTSNYVIFPGNENLLNILERNGKPVNALAEALRK